MFDKKITIGNVLTIATLIIAVVIFVMGTQGVADDAKITSQANTIEIRENAVCIIDLQKENIWMKEQIIKIYEKLDRQDRILIAIAGKVGAEIIP